MINENIIKGHWTTTYHDFTFSTNGMDFIISGGSFVQNEKILFSDQTGGTITIPTTANMNYELYLMPDGTLQIFQYGDIEEVIAFAQKNQITELLAWFTIGTGVTTLDNVQINVKKMVLVDAY
jgi:hypothetical protein